MMMNSENGPLTEQLISEMVRRFYERVMADDSLRPIFEATIHDWEAHHRVVVDFWSRILLNTDRYRGSPYPAHAGLPIGPEHFDRWLTLFREAAQEVLPADAAELAIARAEHMAEAFKAGMFHGFGPPVKPRLGYPVT
jgi:hemoglobin